MQGIIENLDPLMTFKETQKYLRVSRTTLYRMMFGGEIAAQKVGGTWRFFQSEVKRVASGQISTEQGEEHHVAIEN